MVVVEHCGNDDTHGLPFSEDFEGLVSDWSCWTKLDLDNNNAGYPSYWDRTGNGVKPSTAPAAYSGNNCAKHRYLSTAMQNGMLISPRIFLQPNRTSTTLSFYTYEQYPSDCQYEAVAISYTGTDPENFTDVWTQDNASANWKHVTVPLEDYQGDAIYIAFKYSGQNGHNWYIDKVEVTKNDSQCYTEGYLPYTQTFDYEMGWCWYVIDADMSGMSRCWKWNSTEQCVYHPYGQSGKPQEGWLISRPISLWQEDYIYTLTFKSKSTSSGTGRRNSVWISVDQSSSNPPDPADVTEIWVDPSYSNNWTEYEIDLSEYAGHNVNIAFKYEGTYAHNWFIDDFSVSKFLVYTINATADPVAGGTVTGAGTYLPGSTCTLTATANSGYTFVNWTKNNSVVSTNPTYTFTANSSGSYVAHFEQEGDCSVVFDLADSYGDGWNGNKLVVSYGSTTEQLTIESGNSATYTRNFATGTNITLGWINGSYTSECSFTVRYAGGETILHKEGSDLSNSFSFAFAACEGGGGSNTQTTNLTVGWNWWSTYIEANDLFNQLKTGLGDNATQIKSSTSFVNYYGTMWIGGLTNISNESCYLIKAINPCTFEMTGTQAVPSNHPITINPNWNWIGYPNTGTMSITNAFSNFTPASGDQVKSQNAFCTYYGSMWIGGLNTITPGMGLLYKSNSTGTKTLIYPAANRAEELAENVTNEANHWTGDYYAYPSNMTVMAVVELDDVELQGEHYEIAAFANGECRGSAKLMYVAPINRYVAFLTVVGDEASELRFSLYDNETGKVETQNFASLQYETNAIVGSLETPYVIRFRGTTDVDEWANNINVFPNPVSRGERFSLGLPAVETLRATSVQIVNALGDVVETLLATSVPAHITAPNVAGVYTLRITVEGKGTCYRKLVVK